ncbi:MAG: nucleotidyltransferase [Chloroflexi bacterium RBG_16_57_8]|nr:MAG: nucleotidyltransferase [Chloroflexi bacterium RBG_16_57_8]
MPSKTEKGAPRIAVLKRKLAAFCRRNHIRRLSLFGSVLREDFRPDSDVDVLVEFDPGKTPGFAFFGIQEELSNMLGRKVDLNTLGDLSPYFRDRVAREATTLYDAG